MRHFNWIDLSAILLLVRIIYIGYKKGLLIEIFKLSATLFGLFFGIHFLAGVSGFFQVYLFLPVWIAQITAITGLFFVFFLVFFLLRIFTFKITTTRVMPQLDKTGAIISGTIRGILTASLILVVLNFLPSNYIQKSLWDHSLGGPLVIKIAPGIYAYLIKFFPDSQATDILCYKNRQGD